MGRLDPIDASLDEIQTGQAEQATQLEQLATQVGELTAGTVTQDEIDAIAARASTLATNARNLAGQADAIIEPDAGEGGPPPGPPPDEPEPPI